jgi:ribosomal protein S18 acetylase RimI-like enzyme
MKAEKELNIPGLSRSFSLVEFFPKDASVDLWSAYFTLSETIFHEFNQRSRLPNRQAVKQRLSTPNPLYAVNRWMVLDEKERAAGSVAISYDTEVSPDYKSSRHICQIQIAVDPAYRRKKMATCLLQHMIQTANFFQAN